MGTGRLAQALIYRLSLSDDIRLVVAGRSAVKTQYLSTRYNIPVFSLEEVHHLRADIILLAVRDDVVETLAAHFQVPEAVVIHHAGSLPLAAVSRYHTHAGVLYPLQSFAVPESVIWEEVPLLTQSSTDVAAEVITFLAARLGGPVRITTDDERVRIHLCAVWVNNFTRVMLAEAQALCEAWKIPFELLHPLIKGTFSPLSLRFNQKKLITGPAVRGDEVTIGNHLELLKDNPEKLEMYKFISQRIRKLFNGYN